MNAWLDDVRAATRALVRSPLYMAMAVVTLAIGLGATTAAFSVVGTVLLKPLPYLDAGRLVAFYSAVPTFDRLPPSYPDLDDFRTGAIALADEMRSLLFGITTLDPSTFAAVAGLLVVVALIASYVPARRAARVDPVVALRAE
jgi:ABC-type antimicrobial peptide transport system permease subunit